MSNAKNLYQKIMNDSDARQAVANAATDASRIETILNLSEQFALPVSGLEVRAFLEKPVGVELSDDALEMVVGGKSGGGTPQGQHIVGDGFLGGLNGWKDKLSGGEGNDIIQGEMGDDTLVGHGGNDYISGGSDNDFLSGGEGNDDLYGGSGSDTLDGGEGDDYLAGGSGNDELSGGSGADTFAFGSNGGNDTVKDFDINNDSLLFAGAERGDIDVGIVGNNTVITYGDTQVTLENVKLSADEVWDRTFTEIPID